MSAIHERSATVADFSLDAIKARVTPQSNLDAWMILQHLSDRLTLAEWRALERDAAREAQEAMG